MERHRGDDVTGLFTESFRETIASAEVSPKPQTERHSTETNDWHPKDAAERDLALKRLLSCDYDGFISSLVNTYDPTIGPLLCMPREQVQGRLHNMVSGMMMMFITGISMAYGLITCPLGTNEFVPSSFDQGRVEGADSAPPRNHLSAFSPSVETVMRHPHLIRG